MIARPKRRTIGIAFISLLLVLWAVDTQAALYDRPKERIPLPSPIGYVSDHAQVVEQEWKDRIRSSAFDLEKKSGVEMVIVTVPSIKPYPSAKHYADALYEKWQIGSTQQEHGLMVLVAVQERQAAMALGRKMFPVITPTVRTRSVATIFSLPSNGVISGKGCIERRLRWRHRRKKCGSIFPHGLESKDSESGLRLAPPSPSYCFFGGSAGPIYDIPIDASRKVNTGEPVKEASAETGEASAAVRAGRDIDEDGKCINASCPRYARCVPGWLLHHG